MFCHYFFFNACIAAERCNTALKMHAAKSPCCMRMRVYLRNAIEIDQTADRHFRYYIMLQPTLVGYPPKCVLRRVELADKYACKDAIVCKTANAWMRMCMQVENAMKMDQTEKSEFSYYIMLQPTLVSFLPTCML